MDLQEFTALAQELKILANLSRTVAGFVVATKHNNNRQRGRTYKPFCTGLLGGPFPEIQNQLDELENDTFQTMLYVYKPIPGHPDPALDPLAVCVADDCFTPELPDWQTALHQFSQRWYDFQRRCAAQLLPHASE